MTTEATYDQRRSRRQRDVRMRTTSVKRITQRELYAGATLHPYPDGIERPRTRGDCAGGPRPCPFVSCKWHLAIDVNPNGSLTENFPDLEVWELAETCALDVADRDEATLEEVGAIMNLTRERIRQIEVMALGQLGALAAFADEGRVPAGKRRLPTIDAGRATRADVIQAVADGARSIRAVATVVYGSAEIAYYQRAARLLSNLVRDGLLRRNPRRGYEVAS